MSTFEDTREQYSQEHFTVIEIDLPVVTGDCTLSGEPGYNTAKTCDQATDSIQTYKLTTSNAPLLPESGILRVVTSISENPSELKLGKGLASRGTLSIMVTDVVGDPNPFSPAVLANGEGDGLFFAKMFARNEVSGKAIRIKNYRVEPDGSIDLVNGAETRHYILKAMNYNKNGSWTFTGDDELSKVNFDESIWPLPLEGSFRMATDASNVVWSVDANVTYLIGDTVRSGEEFGKIINVSNIGTGSATITLNTRGNDIVYTNTLTKTVAETHDIDDEIFVCDVSDNEKIADLLERILLDVGVDAFYIPKADWDAELDEWHATTRVNTLWLESRDTAEVLEKILTSYNINMWFDPVDQEIKIAVFSAWQESDAELHEGSEIDNKTVNKKRLETLRSTRALVTYKKPYLATSDDVENYRKGSQFKRLELEEDDLFGKSKTKDFGFNNFIDKDSADLLVNRYVNMFSDPNDYSWITQESKRSFKVGEVVDKFTSADVGFDGLPSISTRAQITAIKPMYKKDKREYQVKALSYEPLFTAGSEIVITGNISDINLYTQYAGAPSAAVELTFIFDGTTGGGTSVVLAAISAGAFPAGSKLILILVNGADLQAKGGDGGNGGGGFFVEEDDVFIFLPEPTNGINGGTVFNAESIDCDIYLSGATPSANYPIADGFIRAPGGGDGGFHAGTRGGNGGNGGDGRMPGKGGIAGLLDVFLGTDGVDGSPLGLDWGKDGANNNASGGDKGKGVVDNGGTVNIFGSTALRYINGGGSHP